MSAPFDDSLGRDAGAVHVFELVGEGWLPTDVFQPDALTEGDLFGQSLDLSGDIAVIGVVGYDELGEDAGAAFVFERTIHGWSHAEILQASDGMAEDHFGHTVSVHGTTILVGAYGYDGNTLDRGAAYVFERTSAGWGETAKLIPTDSSTRQYFGRSVAIFGDRAVVGAIGDDDAGSSAGAAYMFRRTSSGWIQGAKVVGSDATGGEGLGLGVALWEDTAAIGTYPRCGVFSCSDGAVYVFESQGIGWVETAKLTPSDAGFRELFGLSIDLWEDTLVVGRLEGCQDKNGLGCFDLGSAFVFTRTGSQWEQAARLQAEDGQFETFYGEAVAVNDRAVLVGATDHLPGGAVYFYELPGKPYCIGTGCPCGNEGLFSGCGNSTSAPGAQLRACGSRSVTSDDLVLTSTDLPPSSPAIFFMGSGSTRTTLGNGQLCVGSGAAGLFRFLPAQGSGSEGRITLGPGIVASSQQFIPSGRIQAGATWYFQAWYRDPAGPCGSTFNLSNGVAVPFSP